MYNYISRIYKKTPEKNFQEFRFLYFLGEILFMDSINKTILPK